ncbi:helix-turn-helix domain-containing protein [Xenorhabdus nematophila]|uniref:Transcriptional regulator with DNA-binding domain n=1 Tax=Xenorhabdus nematophila (strain ATCC 19061 / DSM 3370 / CCUG 14189 / LMG 1036 / NCIMB 9965 / AN6) TaxID=406817 RepID=D3VFW8_XENNA|nr:helix-turn-helix domain-containing protein [Xenorhabdus nematophila]CEE94273.1 putative transcriptional regulator with DNA-binding domain [Xenorhabdus nematophila str. Anatoliense]CEF29849.1 putative transcriptional regulator with DNA-binding domain [Xenorhabdus nematophila str. Websteri]AYA41705.1 helix-turn-helix domain-containing protein [Xenorhabdus nematophila]KHD29085.1 XRE family transcriptional regulator [Xenorhabdus nematophila]MBA0020443.1 helix-turn-helix domain-containing protei
MIREPIKALQATTALIAAVPFLGSSASEKDYRDALAMVDYLIENHDESPLINILAAKIAEYEDSNKRFAAFNKAVEVMPTGVAALRVLMDQHGLSYSDLQEEIGSKSLISQIFSGKRALTIAHIKALSARFDVKPDIFL